MIYRFSSSGDAGADRVISIGLVIAMCCIANVSCHKSSTTQAHTAAKPLAEPIAKKTIQIRVTGHDFQWRFRYAGPDGQLDTNDDLIAAQHLHLPAHSIVSVDLRSHDYAYSFYLPHLDLVETAIPDDPFLLQFETEGPGRHELLGSQMCGYTHSLLIGDVEIHPAISFQKWLSAQR